MVRENGSPERMYPLDMCEGDCDGDWDCKGSLKCFQHDGTEEIPNCSGLGKTGKDYYFDDGNTVITKVPLLIAE